MKEEILVKLVEALDLMVKENVPKTFISDVANATGRMFPSQRKIIAEVVNPARFGTSDYNDISRSELAEINEQKTFTGYGQGSAIPFRQKKSVVVGKKKRSGPSPEVNLTSQSAGEVKAGGSGEEEPFNEIDTGDDGDQGNVNQMSEASDEQILEAFGGLKGLRQYLWENGVTKDELHERSTTAQTVEAFKKLSEGE